MSKADKRQGLKDKKAPEETAPIPSESAMSTVTQASATDSAPDFDGSVEVRLPTDSIGTCELCGYYGPGPQHECKPAPAVATAAIPKVVEPAIQPVAMPAPAPPVVIPPQAPAPQTTPSAPQAPMWRMPVMPPRPGSAPVSRVAPQAQASAPQAAQAQPQLSGPVALAFDLYDAALAEFKGNARDAALNVMMFLTESLVFTVGLAAGGNEPTLKTLLQHLGAQISSAPAAPLLANVAAASKVPRNQP